MTRPLKITKAVHFRSMRKGRKELREGVEEPLPTLGSVPRVSRLLTLALHMDDLRRQGEVTDYAELARLAMVSQMILCRNSCPFGEREIPLSDEGGILYMWWFQRNLRGGRIGRVLCFEEGDDWWPFERLDMLSESESLSMAPGFG